MLSLSSDKSYHKVDSEGNHLRGNFGYCGADCSEEDDDEEFDEEVSSIFPFYVTVKYPR